MRRTQALWVAFMVTGLSLILAGCGETGTPQRPAATATTAPLPTATATPAPSPTIYFAGETTASDGSMTGDTMYALNSTNGSVRWSKALDIKTIVNVAAGGADLYVADGFGSIIALSPTDGRQLWQVKSAHIDGTLPVADALALYIGSQGGSTTHAYVDAYRSTDGKVLWERDLGVDQSPNLSVAGGILYVGSQKTLTALRTTDGSVVWTANVPDFASTPYPIGDTVYLNDFGVVYAFDVTNGSLKWQYTPTSQSPMGDVSVSSAGGLVFAGNGSTLNALYSATGAVAWTSPLSALFYSTSAYSNVVYASPGATLVALDATTGARMWNVTLSGGAGYAPIARNGMLFESRSDGASQQPSGYIFALNPADGSILWHFAHPHEAYTSLAVM